jgi:hypothetical protein
VNEDRGHGAMPKLYGAPAYARPPMTATNQTERPFDPDELPIEAERSPEEKELLRELAAHPYEAVTVAEPDATGHGAGSRNGLPFKIRLPGRTDR